MNSLSHPEPVELDLDLKIFYVNYVLSRLERFLGDVLGQNNDRWEIRVYSLSGKLIPFNRRKNANSIIKVLFRDAQDAMMFKMTWDKPYFVNNY